MPDQTTKVALNTSVDKSTIDAIDREAQAQDRTRGSQANRILREWAENRAENNVQAVGQVSPPAS